MDAKPDPRVMLAYFPLSLNLNVWGEHVAQTVSKLHVANEIAHERLQQHQAHMKKHYDRSQNDVIFRVGDQVYLYVPVVEERLSKKLSKFWRGPFVITEKISLVNYKQR